MILSYLVIICYLCDVNGRVEAIKKRNAEAPRSYFGFDFMNVRKRPN